MMQTKVVPSTLLSRFREEGFHGRERELKAAEEQLAERLGLEKLSLHSFNETTAIYEAPNGHYVRAGYKINRNKGEVFFAEFADLRVNNQSLQRENREDLSKLVGSLLDEDTSTAEQVLQKYLERRRVIKEATEDVLVTPKEDIPQGPGEEEIRASNIRQAVQEALGTAALFEMESVVGGAAKKVGIDFNTMKNAAQQASKEYGSEPVQQITLKTIDTQAQSRLATDRQEKMVEEVVTARRSITPLREKEAFAEATKKVKTLNATGELDQIGEAMSELVTSAPELLYLTIDELAEEVRGVLEAADAKNWDDQLCLDIAEGAQKLAAGVYTKKAARISEAAAVLWEGDEEVSDDNWEAYKEVTHRLFNRIVEGEKSLQRSAQEVTEIIERVVPILQDEGYRAQNTDITAIARSLGRFKKELETPTLEKLEEVVKFITDYILSEALQLDDEGNPPKDIAMPNKGDAKKDPNDIVYRNHPEKDLGPYGEGPPQVLSEDTEEEVEEAWQLDDEGDTEKEMHPDNPSDREEDPNAKKPYRVHTKRNLGYKKDADSKEVDDLNVDDYEEVDEMGDLVVPAEKMEALQLDEEGDTPKDAHPKDGGDSEKDPNQIPYRTWDPKKPLGYIFQADGEKED